MEESSVEQVYSAGVNARGQVWQTFIANWYLLVLSAVIASVMKVYVDQKKVSAILKRNRRTGVLGATVVACCDDSAASTKSKSNSCCG
jgi:uncharacterized membrane protein YraQ (UPF0718 family)